MKKNICMPCIYICFGMVQISDSWLIFSLLLGKWKLGKPRLLSALQQGHNLKKNELHQQKVMAMMTIWGKKVSNINMYIFTLLNIIEDSNSQKRYIYIQKVYFIHKSDGVSMLSKLITNTGYLSIIFSYLISSYALCKYSMMTSDNCKINLN